MLWWWLSFIALGFSLFLFWPLMFRGAAVSDSNVPSSINAHSTVTRLIQALVLLVVFVVVALFEYDRLGAFNEIQLTSLLEQSVQRPLNAEELNEVFSRIDTELQRSTEDVEWRFIKARILFAQGDYREAVTVFQQVVDELPATAMVDKAAALAQMAQADFFANDQKLSELMRQNLLQAVALDSEQKTALGLLGIDAFARGAYQQAINHWRALQVLVKGTANAKVLESGIQNALTQLQQQGGASAQDEISSAGKAPVLVYSGLSINVSLDQALTRSFPESVVLFVYAKVEGQSMPVAVKKIVQPEFPISVILTDADSPMPTARLSSYKQVNLTARLSLTGSIQPMAGDILSHRENIEVLSDTEETISMVLKSVL